MKIKCDNPSTRAFTFEHEHVELNAKGIGTISDEKGSRLIADNPHFTQVKSTTRKKESTDGE